MMTVLCLTTGLERLPQANLSFNESIKLGLDKKEIMEEIGDLYAKLDQPDQALIAYHWLTTYNPEYAEGLQKYAQVLESPCRNQNIDLALDIYKRAINLIDGDNNKHEIAKRMEFLYSKVGRMHEMKDIQQYLQPENGSGLGSDDDDINDDGSFV